MKKVELYSDGACSGNPGPGGWCCILTYNGREKMFSGGESHTTNNKMELTAVIEGLKKIKQTCEVHVYSDSKYIVDAVNEGWLETWRLNGWRKSNKEAVKNQELWEEMIKFLTIHRVHITHVKGHSGHLFNERCDKEAVRQVNLFKQADSPGGENE